MTEQFSSSTKSGFLPRDIHWVYRLGLGDEKRAKECFGKDKVKTLSALLFNVWLWNLEDLDIKNVALILTYFLKRALRKYLK